jgi:outer membrane protein assembly factor BamB
MVSKRILLPIALTACLLTGSSAASAAERADAALDDFSVLHFTDLHIDPHLARHSAPGPLRGGETIRWICAQAAQPQELAPFGLTAPPPAFAIATGDLTEYGVIDDTWQVFERAVRDLPCPLYVVPGNHDNTWVAMYGVMRKRHGGENHSFDRFGCHFVCICSASPQEPVPTIDAKTRTWLKADLERTPTGTPIFIALHHPLYSGEFANPAEKDTLVDLLRDHNVVLLLYGHGHGANHRDIGGIPGVMGGSTFGKNAGYGILSVQDDMLRYAYRYHRDDPADSDQADEMPEWKPLLELPITREAKPRLFDIKRPSDRAVIAPDTLNVQLTVGDEAIHAEDATVSFRIDGQERASVGGSAGLLPVDLSIDDLTPGAHLLSVAMRLPDGSSDLRTRVFHVGGSDIEVVWRRQLPAAVKAGPIVAGDLLIVASTDGLVTAFDKQDGSERWSYATGGEILGTPAWSAGTLVFGSGGGKVYALDRRGVCRWTFDAGRPVYGWPLTASDTVFIGDNGGRMHALNLADGKPRWTFERADYGIESRPAVWEDLVLFGAWDGYLYALARENGDRRWRSLGPKASEGKAARYFSPADCGPLVIGAKLFVCDRGYQLGTYSIGGKLESKRPAKASAIGPAENGRSFYARTTDDRLCKLGEDGEVLWQVSVPAGRFPIPPTEHAGRVYVCSNRGRLSVLDASDGQLLWAYQATPGFYVMAPVAVDSPESGDVEPVCYVASMDGWLTAVRHR